MFRNRFTRAGLVVMVALGVLVLALAAPDGITQAQGGPGGRGSGGPGNAGNGAGGYGPGYGPGIGLTLTAGSALNETALAALTAGIQDEYNAYNTYQMIIDQFGPVLPFVNIQAAEAQHIAVLGRAFTRYGVAIPAAQLLTEVPQFSTVAEACAAGVQVETANAALYDRWIAQVQAYPDLVQVFTALRDASLNSHLPALELCAG